MKLNIRPWLNRRGEKEKVPARDGDGAPIPASEADTTLRDEGEDYKIKSDDGDTASLLAHIMDGLPRALLKPDDPIRTASVYGALIALKKNATTIELQQGDGEWLERLLDRRLGKALNLELGYDEDSELTYGLHRYGLDLSVVRAHLDEVKA